MSKIKKKKNSNNYQYFHTSSHWAKYMYAISVIFITLPEKQMKHTHELQVVLIAMQVVF